MTQKQIYISDYDYNRLDAMIQAFKNVWTRDMESITMLQNLTDRCLGLSFFRLGLVV